MLLWLKLNIYSLTISAFATAILIVQCNFRILHNVYIVIPLCMCSSLLYYKSLSIFLKFNYKKKILEKLVQKAMKHYDQRLFLPYMNSPCMRSVVYFSLCEIKRKDDYKSIKERAKKESCLFDPPRVVSINYDKQTGIIFSAHDRITGEMEEL